MTKNRDTELIDGLQRGDSAAFAEIVNLFGPRLLASGTRLLGNREEAQDAVQETLLSVWKNVGKFERASSVYSWMHRILINTCLARLRSARLTKEVRLSPQDETTFRGDGALSGALDRQPGPSLEKRIAMRRVIERALRQIPEEFRVVLLLRDVEELSSKETAEHLGVPDALVRQRLHRARSVMAEILRPELCSGPELTCGGRLDLLMDFMDGALSQELLPPVSAHIQSCENCSNLLAGFRETVVLPKVLQAFSEEVELSPQFLARVLERIAH